MPVCAGHPTCTHVPATVVLGRLRIVLPGVTDVPIESRIELVVLAAAFRQTVPSHARPALTTVALVMFISDCVATLGRKHGDGPEPHAVPVAMPPGVTGNAVWPQAASASIPVSPSSAARPSSPISARTWRFKCLIAAGTFVTLATSPRPAADWPSGTTLSNEDASAMSRAQIDAAAAE